MDDFEKRCGLFFGEMADGFQNCTPLPPKVYSPICVICEKSLNFQEKTGKTIHFSIFFRLTNDQIWHIIRMKQLFQKIETNETYFLERFHARRPPAAREDL
ncbi:MAG: hypothetical protein HDT26_10500 [Subdoligranulum sp.]|nr:hypothetical protein [Subdoligranulum sp.]